MSLKYKLFAFGIAVHAALACGSIDDAAEFGAAQGGYVNGAGGSRSSGGAPSHGAGGSFVNPPGGFNVGGNVFAQGGSSATPAAGAPPVPEHADVVLYHQSDVSDATTNRIVMRLFIQNRSAEVLPLAHVTVRYWMTSEVREPYLHSYYAGNSVHGESLGFVDAGPASRAEIAFTGGTIARGDDLNLSEFDLQIDGGTFVQSDDYSFDPRNTERRPNDKITVYLAGRLIWGCEPSGSCPGNAEGAGGAGAGGAGGSGGAGGEGGAASGDLGGAGGAPGWSSGGEGGLGGERSTTPL